MKQACEELVAAGLYTEGEPIGRETVGFFKYFCFLGAFQGLLIRGRGIDSLFLPCYNVLQ